MFVKEIFLTVESYTVILHVLTIMQYLSVLYWTKTVAYYLRDGRESPRALLAGCYSADLNYVQLNAYRNATKYTIARNKIRKFPERVTVYFRTTRPHPLLGIGGHLPR